MAPHQGVGCAVGIAVGGVVGNSARVAVGLGLAGDVDDEGVADGPVNVVLSVEAATRQPARTVNTAMNATLARPECLDMRSPLSMDAIRNRNVHIFGGGELR